MAKVEIGSLTEQIGKELTVCGWVHSIRDHKNIIFVDLRDRSGLLQVVVWDKELVKKVSELGSEDLIEVTGKVQERPANMVNTDIATGKIEFGASEIKLISKAAPLPFEIDKDTKDINESIRLKYRYLDLRTKRMAENIKMRHAVNLFLRNFFSDKGFYEIETPCLGKGTPEGAREFLVPSRQQKGDFYVLPQSPQQYKQLLMVAGMEKYFQIARCFRDEDQRGDRQPEFTQLDVEMSFVEQEDILNLVEKAMIELVKENYPDHKIEAIPFTRLTYEEAMGKYGSDKPDLRSDKNDTKLLHFAWVTDFPLFEQSDTEKKLVSTHHPFTRPITEDIPLLDEEPLKVRSDAYDLVLNGFEIGGGSIRIHEQDLQHKIFELLGVSEKDIQERFGHMLEAFKFSPPPHGGIALGLDRVMQILQGEENIREVIAFPKTGDAKDLLFGAPSPMPESALREVHIKIRD